MEDIVTARADYGQARSALVSIRIRLNCNGCAGAPSRSARCRRREVEVAYVQEGKLQSVKGKACVLACYNGMVPYLCPELPESQKEALHYGVKEPFIYTHVAIRNWTAFHKLGIRQIISPGGYHCFTMLDFPVSLGTYEFPSNPQEPMVLFMLRTPCKPGRPRRDQYRMGRFELINTPFSTFERNIRDQLQRMLSPGGFNSSRDIAAITVNRWAHGYAYEYDSFSDPQWAPEERPCVIGRKQFGTNFHRQFRRRRQRLHQCGHRPGLSRCAGTTEELMTLTFHGSVILSGVSPFACERADEVEGPLPQEERPALFLEVRSEIDIGSPASREYRGPSTPLLLREAKQPLRSG